VKLEHVALNVPEPVEMASWYVENLGMRVVVAEEQSPFIHFLADSEGQGLIEIYNNPGADIPDYATMHPLMLHLAFSVENMEETRERLIAAGATPHGEIQKTARGDQLAFLRDPWNIPLQLASRSTPLI
jgi:glyoxylase I family protein